MNIIINTLHKGNDDDDNNNNLSCSASDKNIDPNFNEIRLEGSDTLTERTEKEWYKGRRRDVKEITKGTKRRHRKLLHSLQYYSM